MTQASINQELVVYFLETLRDNSKKSQLTIENIERDLKYFVTYLSDHGNLEINSKSILEYLMFLEDRYPESSYIVKASSIRQFVNWLNLEENPFWNIKLNISYDDFQYYRDDEIFAHFSEGFDYEHLIVRMIYELYLSVNEIKQLNLEHYNKAKGVINTRNTEICLSDELQSLLKEYLKSYREALLGQEQSFALQDPLLISRSANKDKIRMADTEIIEILQNHSLRNSQVKRTRIIDLLNQGKQLSEVEELLGIKLSNFYQPFVKEKEYRLLSAYRQFHPRAQC